MFLGNGTEIVAGSRELGYSPGPSSTSALAGTSGPMQFYIVPNGDPKTFEAILGAYDRALWAKDKSNVYCEGTIIPGADPSTVMLIDNDQRLRVLVDGKPYIYVGCTICDEGKGICSPGF